MESIKLALTHLVSLTRHPINCINWKLMHWIKLALTHLIELGTKAVS